MNDKSRVSHMMHTQPRPLKLKKTWSPRKHYSRKTTLMYFYFVVVNKNITFENNIKLAEAVV